MKQALKTVLNSVGVDISRTHRPGFDAFTDLQTLFPVAFTIFDVGANVGQSALRFRRLFPDAVIHSFEPGAKAFQQLSEATRLDERIHPWNFGLGETVQRQKFFESSELVMSSFLPTGKDGWQKEVTAIEAELSTVDSFCRDHSIDSIDILKTDTQGFDLNVLKGAAEVMRSGRIRAVLTEINFGEIYEGQGSPAQIFEHMSACGFRLFSIYQIFRIDGWAAWTDALFVRP